MTNNTDTPALRELTEAEQAAALDRLRGSRSRPIVTLELGSGRLDVGGALVDLDKLRGDAPDVDGNTEAKEKRAKKWRRRRRLERKRWGKFKARRGWTGHKRYVTCRQFIAWQMVLAELDVFDQPCEKRPRRYRRDVDAVAVIVWFRRLSSRRRFALVLVARRRHRSDQRFRRLLGR